MSAESITKTLLEALKLAPRYLVSLAVLAALLLFSGNDFLKRIGLFDFTQNYRQWIGLVFVASLVLFVADRAVAITRWVGQRMHMRKFRESAIQHLHALTEDEKKILRFYAAKQTKTNVLRIDDGVVQGLVAHGIIFRSAQMGNMMEGFAHNITEFAWQYMHEHPEILDGTTLEYRTDKRQGMW